MGTWLEQVRTGWYPPTELSEEHSIAFQEVPSGCQARAWHRHRSETKPTSTCSSVFWVSGRTTCQQLRPHSQKSPSVEGILRHREEKSQLQALRVSGRGSEV